MNSKFNYNATVNTLFKLYNNFQRTFLALHLNLSNHFFCISLGINHQPLHRLTKQGLKLFTSSPSRANFGQFSYSFLRIFATKECWISQNSSFTSLSTYSYDTQLTTNQSSKLKLKYPTLKLKKIDNIILLQFERLTISSIKVAFWVPHLGIFKVQNPTSYGEHLPIAYIQYASYPPPPWGSMQLCKNQHN